MDERIRRWVEKALEDFRIVQHELSFPDEEIATGPVCFHCQQVVEKLLKAYLILKGTDFGKTHNLEFLVALCMKHDSDFERLDIGDLTFYAVEVRYPNEFYIPTVEEARKCFKIASESKDFILQKLKTEEI